MSTEETDSGSSSPGLLRRGIELVVLQAAWIVTVGAAGRGNGWLGPLVVGLLVAAHLVATRGRMRESLFLAALGIGGSLIDSLQGYFGILVFRLRPAPWLAPLWITAMWVHLGLQLRGPLRGLVGQPWIAALVGAFGGPLAYWAGVRLGAAELHPTAGLSFLVIGLVWAIAFPAAAALAGATERSPLFSVEAT